MDFLGLILLQFVVFYIVGLITVIRYVFGGGKHRSGITSESDEKIRGSEPQEKVYDAFTEKALSNTRHETVPAQPFISLENINVLLYLGAFLLVVAVGIFVGFSYESLTGVTKTVLVTLFSLSFYAIGIALYLKTKKIKPAGLTFATIGLVSFPLVGLAAYNFVYQGTFGYEIWFVTSLATFGLYLISVIVLKQVYISYLMAFTSLSIFESSISLFNVPIYYYTWVMALTSLVYILLAKLKVLPSQLRESYQNTSILFLPFSVMFSFVLAGSEGWAQTGVNLILTAAYCFISHLLTEKEEDRDILFGLAVLLAPLGIYIILRDNNVSQEMTALTIAGIGMAYVVAMEFLRVSWKKDRRLEILSVVGGLGVIAAAVLITGKSALFSAYLAIGATVNAYIFYRTRVAVNFATYLFAVLVVPHIFFRSVVSPQFSEAWMAIVYLFMTFILLGSRMVFQHIDKSTVPLSVAGYFISLGMVLMWAYQSHSDLVIFCIFLLVAGFIFCLSYLEKTPLMVGLSILLGYVAMFKVVKLANLTNDSYPIIFAFAGMAYYGLGHLFDNERNILLRIGGITGPYLGTVFGRSYFTGKSIQGIGSLLVASGLSYAEANKRNSLLFKYISVGVGVLALEWFYQYLDITQQQVYTVTWAIYFGGIAYIQHTKKDEQSRDILACIAMGFLTIPLAGQALNDQRYALVLIMESLGLILGAMALKYRLMRAWGVIALISTVLYQIRDFFLGLPAWAIFGLLGMSLLAGAIVLLSKRKE